MTGLLLLACVARRPPPAQPVDSEAVALAAQISLSVDYSAGRATLTVHSLLPEPRPLPAERNGVPMDACREVRPTRATADMVLKERAVVAECGGEALALEEQVSGLHRHRFEALPEPGLRCAVTLDGVRVELPPLPEPPDPHIAGAHLRWTPGDGDELRYVVPQVQERSWICRLSDDGEAPVPPGARLQQAFFTRHRLSTQELPKKGGVVAVTVTSGVWVDPETL
ncbi:MAG: hypothetical protein H6741_23560 [Alphaproteobacteria bacterium]|nr:hypothetical protein [Alphaproteobacteria bacterium]MCB9795685.1 hypothetical protein [Alphaproteobacteria bacterium]